MGKVHISKFIFYILYTLLLVYFMCNKVVFMYDIRTIIYNLLPIALVFLICIQSTNYKFKSVCILIFSIFLGLLTYLISDCSDLFLTLLFIIASKTIKFEEFLKFDFRTKFLITTCVATLSFLGLTNDVITYRDGIARYSLGFGHPNTLGAFLFSMCVDLVCLNYKKMKSSNYIFIFISFLISTLVCNSRSAQIGIILLLICNFIFPLLENKKIVKKIIQILPFFFLILSIVLVKLYLSGNSLIYQLDDMISNRIRYAAEFYQFYDLTLFGNYFEYFGKIKETSYLSMLDNAYINLLLRYGIIAAIFITYMFSKVLKKSYLENKYGICLCFSILFIYGLMESCVFMIAYNSLLLYISDVIYFKGR